MRENLFLSRAVVKKIRNVTGYKRAKLLGTLQTEVSLKDMDNVQAAQLGTVMGPVKAPHFKKDAAYRDCPKVWSRSDQKSGKCDLQ